MQWIRVDRALVSKLLHNVHLLVICPFVTSRLGSSVVCIEVFNQYIGSIVHGIIRDLYCLIKNRRSRAIATVFFRYSKYFTTATSFFLQCYYRVLFTHSQNIIHTIYIYSNAEGSDSSYSCFRRQLVKFPLQEKEAKSQERECENHVSLPLSSNSPFCQYH